MALRADAAGGAASALPGLRPRRSVRSGARSSGADAAAGCRRRRPGRSRLADLGDTLGTISGVKIHMSQAAGAPRWKPSPLLKGSAALHVGAAAVALARPELWPYALSAVALNHVGLTAAGLWPRSRWLGPNWTTLPRESAERGEV